MEANESKRRDYLDIIKDISKDKLVYIDESGIERNISKENGWGKKGKILADKKSGKYYERTNIISGLSEGKSLAPLVFKGSCNTELFEEWVK